MPAAQPTFVEWLVDRYAQAGNRRLFGVPGGGTSLDLIDAARRRGVGLVLEDRLLGQNDAAALGVLFRRAHQGRVLGAGDGQAFRRIERGVPSGGACSSRCVCTRWRCVSGARWCARCGMCFARLIVGRAAGRVGG